MTELEKLTKDLNEAEEKLRAAPDNRFLKRIIVNRKADIAKLRGKRESAYGTTNFGPPARFNQPMPRFGGEASIPETRNEILEKHLAEVAAKGVSQIPYSSGEFVGSSLLLTTTPETCKDRHHDLDGAQHDFYLDPQWGVYWRRTGSWD